jgi:uncharacterized membrane protein
MDIFIKLEEYLEPYFARLPQLSKDTRRLLADVWPWLTLFVGVMQVLSAWWLFQWAQKIDMYTDVVKNLSTSYGIPASKTGVTFFAWVAVGMLLINGVILLIAFPKLLKKQLGGWRLLFLVVVINLAYGLVATFIDGRGGIVNFLGAVLGSAIATYLLFQISEHYGGKGFKSISSKKVKIDKDSSKTKPSSSADSVTKKDKTK